VRAVVVAHGDVDAADVEHVRAADLIVAADGGTDHLARWGITPHLVVGDLDSLGAEQIGAADGEQPDRAAPPHRHGIAGMDVAHLRAHVTGG